MPARIKVALTGLVQGVGFRPFIHNLAVSLGLSGFVFNTGRGVVAEFQGNAQTLAELPTLILTSAPAAAEISELLVEELSSVPDDKGFYIAESITGNFDTLIPYDQAICEHCLDDFYNPQHRHYMNFFISCTNCGPRYSVIRQLPYDRENTAMDAFPMCSECQHEYDTPSNRRFHAQSTTCPACGPRYSLYACADDKELSFDGDASIMNFATEAITGGKVIALQGIGGFHLLCDPVNELAVAKVRDGKRREGKPLAVIANNTDVLKHVCHMTPEDALAFNSRQNPILLLPLRTAAFSHVNDCLNTLGVMRPYTAALHYLLKKSGRDFLIATSGNLSGRPMATCFANAKSQLSEIADYIISHNREIVHRCDDAVAFTSAGIVLSRPGRGFSPLTIHNCTTESHSLLAMGPEQKSTISIFKDGKIITSEYLGDLDTFEYRQVYDEAVERFLRLQHFTPSVILHDLNADYYSSRVAIGLAARLNVPVKAVQHHEAHIASVMIEHNLKQAIGFAFDGTGYGRDGTVWGGEGFIAAHGRPMERFFHSTPFPLVGGVKSIEDPSRLLYYFLKHSAPETCHRIFGVDKRMEAIYRSVNSANYPQTSSVGRLFDAAAVLLGCGQSNKYDAMLPMHLESLADTSEQQAYPLILKQGATLTFSPHELIAHLAGDLDQGTPPGIAAARFHNTLAALVLSAAENARNMIGVSIVALSGGVFQNRLLLSRTKQMLTAGGFTTFHNNRVPINDSGISVGQIAASLYF